MFDINFVRKSLSLRQRVLRGEHVPNILDELEALRSTQPSVFQIETTNACNMSCVMCPRTTLMDRAVSHIDQEVFEQVVDQLPGFTPEELKLWDDYVARHGMKDTLAEDEDYFYHFICSQSVTLHGFGEPLMDNRLVDRIQYCTDKGLRTYLSANPVNIRMKQMDKLGKAGLTYLKFHLDGVTNEDQKHYRGRVDDTYATTQQRILDTLELFEQNGYPTRIILTKLKFNQDDSLDQEFLDFWRGRNVFAYIKNQHNRWLYEEENATDNTAEYMQRFCDFPWNSMSILKGGEVVPCPLEYNADLVMGNVKEESLEEIWNGKNYQDLRRMHVTGDFPEGHFCTTQCDFHILHDRMAKG